MTNDSVATFPVRAGACGEGRRGYSVCSPPHYLHQQLFVISKHSFFFVVVDVTFYFTFSCCDGPADLCTDRFFILVYCVAVLIRESRWVEKGSFPVSKSSQAV